VITYALQHNHGARTADGLGDTQRLGTIRRRQQPTVHVVASHRGEGLSIEREHFHGVPHWVISKKGLNFIGETDNPAHWEARPQQSSNDQWSFSYNQTTTLIALEVTEIIKAGIGGISNVHHDILQRKTSSP
jgi:hypothetical protein